MSFCFSGLHMRPWEWVPWGIHVMRQHGVSQLNKILQCKVENSNAFRGQAGNSVGGESPGEYMSYIKRAAAALIHSNIVVYLLHLLHALHCSWCSGHRTGQGEALSSWSLCSLNPSPLTSHTGIQACCCQIICFLKRRSQNVMSNLLIFKCWQALHIFKRTLCRPERTSLCTQFGLRLPICDPWSGISWPLS